MVIFASGESAVAGTSRGGADAAGTDRLRRGRRRCPGHFRVRELSGRRPCRPAEARRPGSLRRTSSYRRSDRFRRRRSAPWGRCSSSRIPKRGCSSRSTAALPSISFWATSRRRTGRRGVSVRAHMLRRAIERLAGETRGLSSLAAFEQESTYSGVSAHAWQPYELDMFRRQGLLGEALLAAMRQVGIRSPTRSWPSTRCAAVRGSTRRPPWAFAPPTVLVVTRASSHTRSRFAWAIGRVSARFTQPNGTANGTHIHCSFKDLGDRPALYDESQPWHLSPMGRHFVAGIQHHLPALCGDRALGRVLLPAAAQSLGTGPGRRRTARPRRGDPDLPGLGRRLRRESAAVQRRVSCGGCHCPAPTLALAVLVQAGLDGVRRRLEIETASPPSLPTERGRSARRPGREPGCGRVVGCGRARRLSRLQARRGCRPDGSRRR